MRGWIKVMNKIAQYLNEHILGEVTSSKVIREKFSRDGSILKIIPELVAHPRVTNDIRKIARFTWQLAEKGHIMPMTARGGGSDLTGAAIGKGIIINNLAHLNKIIYISTKSKDQFVHVQPGVNFGTLNETLKSHSMIIPTYPSSFSYSTIGGAVANNSGGQLAGRYGMIRDWVKRLEIVLSNGDLIETTRINRRELNKKKGLQTFEGEIYRKIDGIIEDNQQLIKDKIDSNLLDNIGYPGISQVKQRDGSFDLTPLIVGSQGTLSFISEIVLKTDFYSNEESAIVAVFANAEVARDAADVLATLKPATLDFIDGELFEMSKTHGKKYIFQNEEVDNSVGAVLFASFDDYGDRAQNHKIKVALKKLSKFETTVFASTEHPIDELNAIRDASSLILQPDTKEETMPPLIDGASVPTNRREEFITAIKELAAKHHISLPLQIHWLDNVIETRPIMQLHRVGDKQKVFKLIAEYAELIDKLGGNLAAKSGEGRLKATAAYKFVDEDLLSVYSQIRATFDPFGTMNPGVKQKTDMKTLVLHLNPEYNLSNISKYSPRW